MNHVMLLIRFGHALHNYSRDSTADDDIRYTRACAIHSFAVLRIAAFINVVPWRRPFIGPCRSRERKGKRPGSRRYATTAADVSRSCTFQSARSSRPTNCRYNSTPGHYLSIVARNFTCVTCCRALH